MADQTQQLTPQQNRSPLDVDFGSLIATLPPEYQAMIATLAQAQQSQDQGQLSQGVQAAQQQAQQTGQQYQQMAQEPVPSQGGANFVNQLFGNTASVLGQQPEYGRRAFQQGQDQEKELAQRRVQNLKALADVYEKQAQHAESMGNAEAAEKFRSKLEAAHSKQEIVLEGLKAKAAQDAFKASSQQAKDLQTQRDQAAMDRLNKQISAGRFVKSGSGTETPEEQAEHQSVFDNTRVQTDFGSFIDKSHLPTGKALIPYLKLAADTGTKVVDAKTAAQLGEMHSAWRTLQDQIAQVMPYLSETNDPIKRGLIAMRNTAMKASGNDVLTSFDTQWGNSMRLLRATGPSTGFRFNKQEIDRSMRYDRPNTATDTQPILEQKARNWRLLIENASRPAFNTDWRSIKTAKGKVTVMAPDGKTKEVTPIQAEKLVTKEGYARVFGAEQLPTSGGGNVGPGFRRKSDIAKSNGSADQPAEELWDDTGDEPVPVEQ